MAEDTHTYSYLEASMNGSGKVEASRKLVNPEGDVIRITAEDLRPSKGSTGVHGKLDLYLNDELVVYDNFNIEKLNQRKIFSGEVFKDSRLKATSDYYSRENLNTDLTSFTYDAWNVWVKAGVEIQHLAGDPHLEVEQFIKDYVIRGGGTIINALPKQGKSYIALAMAVSVDAGINQLWDVQQANTLYVNLERSASSMKRRLAGVNTALGLDPYRELPFANVRGRSLLDIMDSLRFAIQKDNIELIVVDSISRAGMGSLTEDGPALAITDKLNSLVEETDRAWVGIAHRGWSNEHVFGSIHFLSACDVMVDIKAAHNKETKEMGVMLSRSGENDLPPSNPTVVGLSFDPMGVNQIRKAVREEFPDLMEETQTNLERIVEYLKRGKQRPKAIVQNTNVNESSVRTILNYSKNNDGSRVFVKTGNDWGLAQ